MASPSPICTAIHGLSQCCSVDQPVKTRPPPAANAEVLAWQRLESSPIVIVKLP